MITVLQPSGVEIVPIDVPVIKVVDGGVRQGEEVGVFWRNGGVRLQFRGGETGQLSEWVLRTRFA